MIDGTDSGDGGDRAACTGGKCGQRAHKPVGVPVYGLTRRSRRAPNPRRSPADRACRRSPRPSPAAGADHGLSQPSLGTRVRLYLTIGGRQQALDCLPVSLDDVSFSLCHCHWWADHFTQTESSFATLIVGERVCAFRHPQSNRRSAVGCASSRRRGLLSISSDANTALLGCFGRVIAAERAGSFHMHEAAIDDKETVAPEDRRHIKWPLYYKAMTFGQSPFEKAHVADYLQKMQQLASERFSTSGDDGVVVNNCGDRVTRPPLAKDERAACTSLADHGILSRLTASSLSRVSGRSDETPPANPMDERISGVRHCVPLTLAGTATCFDWSFLSPLWGGVFFALVATPRMRKAAAACISDGIKIAGVEDARRRPTSRDHSRLLDDQVPIDRSKPPSRIADKARIAPGRFVDDPSPPKHSPEEKGVHFEGDIVLFEGQAKAMYEHTLHETDRRQKRKFIGPAPRRWDVRRPIEYSFDGSHTTREQRIVELALEHWHNITCLNFVRNDNEPSGNRIVFTDVDGCASNVGRHPLGEPQFVSLAPECMRLGVIAHEVAHALGFWHEQSRPDRDQYVDVKWENIDRDSKGQFLKEQPADVDNAGIAYDYGSIMHYRSKAFARFDDLFTINTNIADYQKTIGQRDQLSFNDIRLMNTIYCSSSCPTQLPCQRGGYTDPRRCDRCRCPDGFTGQLCDSVMPGYGAECGGRLTVGAGWTTIKSPGYPNEFKEGQECSWLLVAPQSQHVELQFYGQFEMYCKARHSLCMDYVEIRNSTDFANTGMRYCCYGTPTSTVFSSTEDMLLLFRSFYRGGRGFQVRARAVQSSGTWGAWGSWSICSGSCGACGVRTRTRQCQEGFVCLGSTTESQPCNENPCELCPKQRYETSACGGFLGLIRGVRCKVERTVYEPCEKPCCPGFVLSNGVCKKQ
uniref:Metalloendopeptidase n=1 Tax=Plectus sambesii TaxID=2011161 RepID=A0A914V2T7_9BILA